VGDCGDVAAITAFWVGRCYMSGLVGGGQVQERRLPFGMLTYLLASLINLEGPRRDVMRPHLMDGIIELID
jgi:hypothetical protein